MWLRVLIVEDEFLIAWNAEAVLQDAGIEVAGIATTFETAVSLAEETRPDLVLMDIVLASERDGVDAAIEIRKRFGTPCLFTSANHDADNRMRAKAADPMGWLPKPYSTDSLLQMIQSVAGSASRHRDGSMASSDRRSDPPAANTTPSDPGPEHQISASAESD